MTNLLSVREACETRPPEQTSQHYAANLHNALTKEIGDAAAAENFFAATYPTQAMQELANGLFHRLGQGAAAHQSAVIRLNTMFGGGKTHTLIALAVAAQYPDLARAGKTGGLLLPERAVNQVQLVCYTGENADLVTGAALDNQGRRAKSLTGHLAYHLGGPAAYDRYREHDEMFTDPGAAALRELIGNRPTLILIDEMVQWAAKAALTAGQARANESLHIVLNTIATAVDSSPRAVMVITSPEPGHDAFANETLLLHAAMNNIDSVLSRTSLDFTPTGDADFPAILRQRLFQSIGSDENRRAVAQAYAALARRENPADTAAETRFYDCYPFHPETLRIITEYLASNNNFQRVRGALRALAAILHSDRPIPEPLIHPYHLDMTISEVRAELIARLLKQPLDAAITADITGPTATAQRYGETARQAANTILLGSLAVGANRGLAENEIVKALLSPAQPDSSIARQAIAHIRDQALYIDDDPNAGALRFNQQANVRREVEQRANAISPTDKENGLQKAIKEAFAGPLGLQLFPSSANNVPDDPNRMHLGIVNPDHFTMQSEDRDQELSRLYRHSSANNGTAPRQYPNNVLFLVADHNNLADAKQHLARHQAAWQMLEADQRQPQLADHQRNTLETIRQTSHKAVYQSIQRNWVNLFYPQPQQNPLGLAQARLQFPDQEGKGQQTVIDHLSAQTVGRMAHPDNPALSPTAWADAGLAYAARQGLAVKELRENFARGPNRPMFRHSADFHKALDAANQEGLNQTVVIQNPHGLVIKSHSGVAYSDDMRVWLKGQEPAIAIPTAKPEPEETGFREQETGEYRPQPPTPAIQEFRSAQQNTGQVIIKELTDHMAAAGLDWSRIAQATLYGNTIDLLTALASKAQNCGDSVAIDCKFNAAGLSLEALAQTPTNWLERRRLLDQLRRMAGADNVNAQVRISGGADAPRQLLADLDNTHQITLAVTFANA